MYVSDKARHEDLSYCISICFTLLSGRSHAEIARESGLSRSTINRLWRGEFTVHSRFSTIQSLGYAAGLRLTFGEGETKLSLRSEPNAQDSRQRKPSRKKAQVNRSTRAKSRKPAASRR